LAIGLTDERRIFDDGERRRKAATVSGGIFARWRRHRKADSTSAGGRRAARAEIRPQMPRVRFTSPECRAVVIDLGLVRSSGMKDDDQHLPANAVAEPIPSTGTAADQPT
jgi:hypothetical protein